MRRREWWRSAGMVGAACLALWWGFRRPPVPPPPPALAETGMPLFPELKDPLQVRAVELVAFNPVTASATPLQVVREPSGWVLATHARYPAQATDRVAKTVAMLVDMKKGGLRSDRPQDHAELGVVDPLAEGGGDLQGRGSRLTVRGEGGAVLADVVIGKRVPQAPGQSFVRQANDRRVYASKVPGDLSIAFEDWIDKDLLHVQVADIRELVWNRYRIHEGTGTVEPVGRVTLMKSAEDGTWMIGDGGEWRSTKADLAEGAVKAVDELAIRDARPVPAAMSKGLKSGGTLRLNPMALLALQEKGFFVSGDGRLLSNDGELIVTTWDGTVFTLGFGEVKASGVEERGGKGKGRPTEEARYVLVTVSALPPDRVPEAKRSAQAIERTAGHRERLSPWVFVIAGEAYRALQVNPAFLSPSQTP